MKKKTKFGKYLVIEWKDIEQLPLEYQEMARRLQSKIFRYRKSAGKNPKPRQLVLNQDDDISAEYLSKAIDKFRKNGTDCYLLIKVRDIADALLNAIKKARGEQ